MIDETAVREAMLEDAAAIVAVLRQSITVLCVADHGNDAAALADWLANKTVENVERWLAQPGQHMVVATRAGAVCGVASMGA
ncbi:MAG: GNAT family N-acetyltransferase, partial [Myxococcota bacterium]